MVKRLTMLLMACMLLLGCATSACAQSGDTDETQIPPEFICVDPANVTEDNPIQPRGNYVYYYQNDTLYTGKTSYTLDYVLDSSYDYAKIWVKNNSTQTVHVTTTCNGSEIGSGYDVAANGGTKIFYVKANGNYGHFYSTVATTGGGTLYGLVSVKVGTKTGVGYPY